MKETKFRAWDKLHETMRDVCCLNYARKSRLVNITIYISEADHYLRKLEDRSIDEVELLQHTGLKDKNGKEIHEGDVVNISNWKYAKNNYEPIPKKKDCEGIFVVELELTNWGFEFSWRNISGYACSTHIMGDTDEDKSENVEIIGNVFENPELLEDNK